MTLQEKLIQVIHYFAGRALFERTLALEQLNAGLSAKVKWFADQLLQFGASNKKTSPESINLFKDAKVTGAPRIEETECRLSKDSQNRTCCRGIVHEMSAQKLKAIGTQVNVVKHIEYIYTRWWCESEITNTSTIKAKIGGEDRPLDRIGLNSIPTLTFSIDQEYNYSLPLYHQQSQFARSRIDLSRKTIFSLVFNEAHSWVKRNTLCIHEELIKRFILHGDET